jgi:NAD dependent epimerase/dehydratase
MKSVFITGSEGFFGSTLVEYLLKKNYRVKALVQYNSFQSAGWLDHLSEDERKKVSIIFGDIRDKEFLEKHIKNNDIIVNLAALIAIPYSYEAPRSYVDTNLLGMLNLLEVAKKKRIKKFIQTSTSEVYGSAQFVPMTENHPLNPQSPYAASKSACDQLALSYYYSYDLPITILRPFNMFGPRQSLRAVIPTIITQALDSKAKTIRLGNLSSTRDYTYVLDTAIAFEKSFGIEKINGKIINIGSGFEISVKDIVSEVFKILNKKLIIIQEKKRLRPKKSEVNRLYSSNVLAKKYLNWTPRYSGKKFFKDGIKKTITWYLDNYHLFKDSSKYKM